MSGLYPLILHPEFYERVWGVRNLAPIYSREITGEPIGEAWLTGDGCRVANGPLAGASLGDLCKKFGAQLVGEAAGHPERFPLLMKFLFTRDKLSVQVHPDDERAARVGLRLKAGTTKAEVERAVRETRMEELLNWIDVAPGDMIYVDAGTVHAI